MGIVGEGERYRERLGRVEGDREGGRRHTWGSVQVQ